MMKNIISVIKKNSNLLLSILLLICTISLFGPLELYLTNYNEFWFSCSDTLIIVVILMSGGFIFSMTFGFLLKGKLRDLYSCILFTIGIALYIQGNYININYGILNGETINWDEYPVYAVLDTAVWLMLIIGTVFLWRYKGNIFYKIQKYVSIYIIAIQVITIIYLFCTTNVLTTEKSEYYLSTDGIYDVSSNDNIIIFVLDAFDDTYFQEILDENYEKYETIFQDFTHFKNATVGAARTKVAMPAIISGEPYPGEVTFTDYISESFDNDELYTTLQKKNYDIRFYTESFFIPDNCTDKVNNQVSSGYKVSSFFDLTKKYLSLTLYKYAPHMLKKYFWIYSADFEQYKTGNTAQAYKTNDVEYFDGLQKKGLQINKKKNIFRLFHLKGAHPPYTTNEYMQNVNMKETSVIQQAKGALYIVDNYISQMKKKGVYDSSTIIIMADHGDKGYGSHGILLVKEKNQSKSFSETNSPVSYYDLHATIFQEIGITSGDSFFDILEDADRTRYFYIYDAGKETMKVVEYIIEGDINEKDVVKETGVVLLSKIDRHYEYGNQLTFGGNGTAFQYISLGIATVEMSNYWWTDGYECEFEFEFDKVPKKNILVTMDIGSVNNINGPQRVKFYANSIECHSETIFNNTQIQFLIPGTAIGKDKKLTLHMDLPDAVAPADVFGEGDPRLLGLAICGLSLVESSQDILDYQEKCLNINTSYKFGSNGNGDEYLLNGWYTPEIGHVWGKEYSDISVKTTKICDYDVTLRYSTYIHSGSTTIYVNNTPLTTLENGDLVTTIRIPKDILKESGNQVISFKTENAVSPYSVGESEDKRIFGICLYTIDISMVE